MGGEGVWQGKGERGLGCLAAPNLDAGGWRGNGRSRMLDWCMGNCVCVGE